MLVASPQADFAAFVQSGQHTRQCPARSRFAVLDLLAAAPGLSDREIARRVECSPQTVGYIRRGTAACCL
ncbi:Homeodomain-like domain-containing protein [Paracoccus laeviglucosivorans]|uniref:Homeodomain-like domain-containing protein n=1 Tax=Paracoccus laeviglucosivorans TaxID=1197861 RepID=A0A521DD36_9RHOB|nr:Homeodomain-like domain-containing protein [Paracoccus laeviglucosivorans]